MLNKAGYTVNIRNSYDVPISLRLTDGRADEGLKSRLFGTGNLLTMRINFALP